MSYSIKDAQIEQDEAIFEALNNRDSIALFQLAVILKEQGDDEQAERLLKTARSIEAGDWAYDESINN